MKFGYARIGTQNKKNGSAFQADRFTCFTKLDQLVFLSCCVLPKFPLHQKGCLPEIVSLVVEHQLEAHFLQRLAQIMLGTQVLEQPSSTTGLPWCAACFPPSQYQHPV